MRRVIRSGWAQPAVFVFLIFTLSAIASAASITGGFGTAAAGVITFANATNTVHFIDWCPVNPGTPTGSVTCPVATVSQLGIGEFFASGGSGTFASIPSNPPGPPVPGTIKDMVDQGSVPPYTTFPPGVPVSINNFLTLSTFPNLNFRAELLVLQTCAPSATALCIGPFILTQSGPNVAVTMTINGTVLDTTNVLSPATFTYVISGQFTNTTIAAVAAAAQTTGGIFSNTWSGTLITSAIPVVTTQGCTPGFWKQSFHFGFWTGYLPTQLVSSVFTGVDSALASETLLEALDGGGGPDLVGAERILLRAAVAALLNASNTTVGFSFTTANIIAAVNAAIATGDRDTILQLATTLDNANNGAGGCPLSGQNP